MDSSNNDPLLSQVLDRLTEAKKNKDGTWTAYCPYHADGHGKGPHDPNLKIWPPGVNGTSPPGGFLCHACGKKGSVIDLAQYLGVDTAAPSRKHGKTEAARYDYPDENGDLLYQVVRFEPKNFRQRRPGGRRGWVWNIEDVRRVLYRLPELVEHPEDTVFVVEGEADVDRLRDLGLLATTNSGGAGKWREEYTEILRGREVVILPDNDEPGRKHAKQVAASLLTAECEVKILELPNLPPKGDVSDWLAAGGTVEELKELTEKAPIPTAETGTTAGDDDSADTQAKADLIPLPNGFALLGEPDGKKARLSLFRGDDPVTTFTINLDDLAQRARAERYIQTIVLAGEEEEGAIGKALDKVSVAVTLSRKGEAEPAKPSPAKPCALFPGLVDLVIEEDDKVAFLIRGKDGSLSVSRCHQVAGELVEPPGRESIPWLLPRKSDVLQAYERLIANPEEENRRLFADLQEYFRLAAQLPSERYYTFVAAWTFHATLLEPAHYTPIVSLYAQPERGKTRLGQSMAFAVPRGLHVESLRQAYLFRVADAFRLVMFIDCKDIQKEAERDGSEDLLLARFERGIRVPRVENPDLGPIVGITYYQAFGATVLASNRTMDRILDTRSVKISMVLSTREFSDDIREETCLPMRERLVAWRAWAMGVEFPETQKPARGRLGDIMRPIIQAVSVVNPEAVEEIHAFVQEQAQNRKVERAETLEARLVEALLQSEPAVVNGRLPVQVIADEVNAGRPESKKLSNRFLSDVLGSLGFQKGKVHRSRAAVLWDEDLLHRLLVEYGFEDQEDETVGPLAAWEGVKPSSPPSPTPPRQQELPLPAQNQERHGRGSSPTSSPASPPDNGQKTGISENRERVERVERQDKPPGHPQNNASDGLREVEV